MNKLGALHIAQEMMSKLPFVKWDRYIDYWKENKLLHFYGWIDRSWRYKDFILIGIEDNKRWFTTSSDRTSKNISKCLGFTGKNHMDCRRIEHLFPELPNVIKL